MAWSDVGQEQMVSFADAQSSGFQLRALQTNPGTNQCMSKTEALTRYLLSSGSMASYSSNQLVPKKDWSAGLTEFGNGFNNTVYTVEYQSDGKLIVGGAFTAYKGVTVNRLARLFPDGTLDTDFIFGTNATGTVRCTKVLSDGRIAVGGFFDQYNGVTVNSIVILNPEGTIHTTMTGANLSVFTIAEYGDYLIIGGSFSTFNGASYKRLVKVHSTTGVIDSNFTIGTGFQHIDAGGYDSGCAVRSVYVDSGGWIYAGGAFNRYRGSNVTLLVKLSAFGSLLTTYNLAGLTIYSAVDSVVVNTFGTVICVGNFTLGSPIAFNRIAAFTSTGDPYDVFGTGLNGPAKKVSIIGTNKLLVSGEFGNYNGAPVKPSIQLYFAFQMYIKELNFNPDFNNTVYTHAVDSNNNIVYGGDFTYAADTAVSRLSNRIAQFNNSGTLISN
jgi:hypothetical protein